MKAAGARWPAIRLKLIASAALCVLAAGCATPMPPVDLSQADLEETLAPANGAFSLALAHYGQGVIHEIHRQNDEAIQSFLDAIKFDPGNPDLYLRAARRLSRDKRKDEALDLMRKLMVHRPDSPLPYLYMASMHEADGDVKMAEQNYRKAILVQPERIENYTKLCLLLYEREDYEKAINLLENALPKVREPLKGYDFLGSLYRKQAESAIEPEASKAYRLKGIDLYRKSVEAFPGQNSFYYHLGSLLAREGEVVEAIGYFQELELLNPDNLSIKRRIGDTLTASLGGEKPAINKLKTYTGLHPDDAYSHFYLGLLYEKDKQAGLAVDHYRRSAGLDPVESAPYFKVASLSMTNQVKEAETLLREGEAKLPGNPRILESLAYLLMQQKKFDESMEFFDRVQKVLNHKGITTDTENFHYNYAVAAQQSGKLEMSAYQLYKSAERNPQRLGDFLQQLLRQENEDVMQDGITMLQSVARRMPQEPMLHYYLGLLYNYTQQYAEALRHFKKVEKLAGSSRQGRAMLTAQFFFTYAAATERTGDLKEAERLFRLCIQKDAKHAEARNYLAYMWAEKGMKLDEAGKMIDQAMKLVPDNGAFLDTKGWILYMQGDYQGALKYLGQAATIVEDDPTIGEHVGDALSKLGRHREARDQWKKVLAMEDVDEAVVQSVNQKLEALEKAEAEAKAKAEAEAKAKAEAEAKAKAEAEAKAEAKAKAEAEAKAKAEAEKKRQPGPDDAPAPEPKPESGPAP